MCETGITSRVFELYCEMFVLRLTMFYRTTNSYILLYLQNEKKRKKTVRKANFRVNNGDGTWRTVENGILRMFYCTVSD